MKAKWGRLLQYGFVSWSLSRSPLLSSLSWLRPSHWTNFLLCYCSFQLVVTNWDMGYSELVGNVCQKLNLFLGLIVGLLPTFWSCQFVVFLRFVPGTGIRRRVSTSKRPQISSWSLPTRKHPAIKMSQQNLGPLVLDVNPGWNKGDLPQQSWSLEVSFSGGPAVNDNFWRCEMMRPLFPTFMVSSMSNPPTPTMSRTSMLSLVGNPRKVLVSY